jgi:hypothetical protein
MEMQWGKQDKLSGDKLSGYVMNVKFEYFSVSVETISLNIPHRFCNLGHKLSYVI